MRFPLDGDIPAHWVADNPFLTHFYNALSLVFPEGEKFFIASVRHFETQIADPKLRAQIVEFARQEGHHNHQHKLLNEQLRRQGFDLSPYERLVEEMLEYTRRNKRPVQQLAATAALEHLTALLGDQALGRPHILECVHPQVRPLWAWHAAEETEHKAVAYDVYQAVSGNYPTRVLALLESTVLFFKIVHTIQLDLMRRDPRKATLREVCAGVTYLWGRRGLFTRALPDYLRWFAPRFHPWDVDNAGLIERWLAANSAYVVQEAA